MNGRIILTALSLSIAFATPAYAQTDADLERAVELDGEAKELYQQDDYESAAQKFQAAYDLAKDPALLKSVFISWFEADRCDRALDAIEQWETLTNAEDAEAEGIREVCAERAQEAASEKAPETPSDTAPEDSEVPALDEPTDEMKPARESAASDEPSETDMSTPSDSDAAGISPVVGWTLIGTGAAALATQGVLALVHANTRVEYDAFYEANCDEQACRATKDEYREAEQRHRTMNSIETAQPFLYIGGSALIAGGVTALLLSSTKSSETALMVGPTGLSLQVRF